MLKRSVLTRLAPFIWILKALIFVSQKKGASYAEEQVGKAHAQVIELQKQVVAHPWYFYFYG